MAVPIARKKIRGRLPREVAAIKTLCVVRENNLRSQLSREARTGRILPGAQGAEEFIGNARVGNMEDNCVSRLSLIENEAGRRTRASRWLSKS